MNSKTGKVLAVGNQAREMLGRTPGNIVAVRPLKDGVIADYTTTLKMIEYIIDKTCGRPRVFGPRLLICVPSGVTNVERRAVIQAAKEAGASVARTIEEPMAAAIGAGLPIESAGGNMVVDIGGGTTEVAIISLAATAYSESLRVAGDEVDESIVRYLQKKHQIAIGAIAAERLKLDGASVYPAEGRGNAFSVVGKDLLTGVPKNLRITSEEIREAIEEPVSAIIDAIRRALEKLPPEFASDLNESGMVLTGGGALLGGLDHRIEKETGINVYVADDPLLSVVLGAGKALEDMARYRKVFIN